MGFDKIQYGNDSIYIFETIITDGTGKVMEKWKVSKSDYPQVVYTLNKKYGIGMFIRFKKQINEDRDLDWAMN